MFHQYYSSDSSDLSQNSEKSVDDDKSETALKDDKTETANRRPSPYRDAAFVRKLEGLLKSRGAAASLTTLVCIPRTSIPLDTSDTSTCLDDLIPLDIKRSDPLSSILTAKTPTKPVGASKTKTPLWWHGRYKTNPARSYRVPAPWRDTSDILRLLYAHRALTQLGLTFAVSVRLSAEIEALARSKPAPLTWLQKRVFKELAKALGRPVDFYLVIEEDERRALHLHGALTLLPGDFEFQPKRTLAKVRRALRRAAGEWKTTRQHQIQMKADPDEGWASYCAKNFWKATPWMRSFFRRYSPAHSSFRLTYEGPVLSVTANIRCKAELLHHSDRNNILLN